jgi:hypothetical protein
MARYGLLISLLCFGCSSNLVYALHTDIDGTWRGYIFPRVVDTTDAEGEHTPRLAYEIWIAEGPHDPFLDPEKAKGLVRPAPILVNDADIALNLGELPHEELITVKGTRRMNVAIWAHGKQFDAFAPVIEVDKMWDRYDQRLPLHPMN